MLRVEHDLVSPLTLIRSKRKNQMACVAYDVCLDVTESDHKPVFGIYEARVRPGRDHSGLANGQFIHRIYEEGCRRRANHFILTGSTSGGKKGRGRRGGGGGEGGKNKNNDEADKGEATKALTADGEDDAAPNSKICAIM